MAIQSISPGWAHDGPAEAEVDNRAPRPRNHSALDVSIQAQVVNLFQDLQEKLGLSYVFIAHDLAVVRHISDRIAVMYLGRIVEIASGEALYRDPLHPYTQGLLASVPIPSPATEASRPQQIIRGEPPSVMRPPSGCRFHPRCPFAMKVCAELDPALRETGDGRAVACHLHDPAVMSKGPAPLVTAIAAG